VPVSDAGTRGLQQLQETQRIANDAQNLGMNILDQLGTQRGQIESAIDRRQQAHDGLSTSNRLIRQMHQRATWIKCSLCAIILILLGGIFLVVYLRWLDGHHSSHHPSPSPPSTGRALQVAAPPPPAAAVARSSTDLGAGLIILIVVGGLSLLACALSIPQNLVVRTAVFAASSFLCAAIFLTLLLMPRHGPPSAGATPTGKVEDVSTILRIVLLSFSIFFALCGCGSVVALHATVAQKAPIVVEPEPVELFREGKPVVAP